MLSLNTQSSNQWSPLVYPDCPGLKIHQSCWIQEDITYMLQVNLLNNPEFMNECVKHCFSLVGETRRKNDASAEAAEQFLVAVLLQGFCGILDKWLKLGFAAYITCSLFCSRRWFVEVFTKESHKVAKDISNLKNQSTDLQKMKGILNHTEIYTVGERPLLTFWHPHACNLDMHLSVSVLCIFSLEAKWIFFTLRTKN